MGVEVGNILAMLFFILDLQFLVMLLLIKGRNHPF